jgi:chemotaxis response regulator CheB
MVDDKIEAARIYFRHPAHEAAFCQKPGTRKSNGMAQLHEKITQKNIRAGERSQWSLKMKKCTNYASQADTSKAKEIGLVHRE